MTISSKSKKRLIYFSITVIIVLISSEFFLRYYYGFCDTVLIKADSSYEYIAQPNQKRFRFRHNILYNSESMRSEEIDTSSEKILGFGDSVINGGVLTDQDSLATTILGDSLSKSVSHKVQFLNISAGSWGPDNCYAYLKKYGNFGAKHIYLFVSSHDAYDDMNFEKIVGLNESFPEHQYKFALVELFDRYILPRLHSKSKSKSQSDELGINKQTKGTPFNTGFDSFRDYSLQTGIPLTIYLHAEKKELAAGSYNAQGREIISYAQKNDIPLIKDLNNGLQQNDFRDNIHLNDQGQHKMAMIVLKNIK